MPDNYLNWSTHPNKEAIMTIRCTAVFFWVFRYTIEQTAARWIFIGDDDILINFNLLPAFMREQESKYDPLQDVVIRGDCIMNGLVYPAGGSGIVLSRRAVEQLAQFGNYSVWGGSEDTRDKRVGRVMSEIFSGISWSTSTAFLGSRLDDQFGQYLRNGNFSTLPDCPDPETFLQNECQRFLASTRQIVFSHIGPMFDNGPGWLKKRFAIAHHLWDASPELAFWPSEFLTKGLCWLKGKNATRVW
jgi:hypothetical protein